MRFPGFEGEWENNKLGNLCKIYDGTHQTPTYVEHGVAFYSVEHLTADNFKKTKFISDHIYNSEIKRVKIEKGDILMTRIGDIGTAKYIDWDVKASFYVSLALIKQSSLINSHYLSHFISTNFFQNELWSKTTHVAFPKKINLGEIGNCKILFPSVKEQQKLANFLSFIDNRIQTQSKIIKELSALKNITVTKIFTRQFKFKSHENFEDWKNVTLGEITTLVNTRNKENKKMPIYSINNKVGFVPQGEQFDGVDSNARGYDIKIYKVIDKATFAYNPARINVGSIGYSGELHDILISSLYVCFKTNEKVNDDFFLQYLKTEFFNKQVLANMEGGVRSYLFYENFSRIKLSLPFLKEQEKIASLLRSIDKKIDFENTLLEKLKEQKQYLLSNLFI